MKNLHKRFVSAAVLSAMVFFSVSCSSIMNGSKQDVKIQCYPSDATIFIDGASYAHTPLVIRLKRGKEHLIEIKKLGYETFRISTDNSLTGWFWGNLLCGGLVGMVIDLATGNAYDVDPDFISAQLPKSTASLSNYNSDKYSSVFIKDEKGGITRALTIEWE